MRPHIRDVAAARDLTEEDIKPVLKLKHEEIGHFCERHGVNAEWLLEGKGHILKKAPATIEIREIIEERGP
ncbi:hypothetical protein [Bradyrhizobium sp. Tv2a-2]|uniref:hypothetical protein n=1 Tax=Bradyrhizobium sp. Tv2a-2 TaxID=113395 RepID=UPI0003FB76D8|nr:hypothetical protein [Bradyrhizobium sp. Tv2a-2]